MRVNLLAIPAVLILCTGTAAEPTRVVLKEGDVLGPPGHVIASVSSVATNGVGGFGIALNTNTPGGPTATLTSHILATTTAGVAQPAAPVIVHVEGVVGPYTFTGFEGEFGISDTGDIAYGVTATSGGFTGLDAVFLGSTPLAVQRDVAPPFSPQFWSFASRIRMTNNGVPYWKSGVTNTAGGATVNRTIVRGNPAVKITAGGDVLTNLPTALDLTPASTLFTYRLSAQGNHAVTFEVLDAVPTTTDGVVVVDGAGLLLDGQLVREGSPVPAAVGGRNAENWVNFEEFGITESNRLFIFGDTSATTATDDFMLADGVMRLRDGDTVDGQVFEGDIEEAFVNETADHAIIWDTAVNTIETLLVNRRIVLKEGDTLDLDGDGTPEPTSVISGLGGTAGIALTQRIGGLLRAYVVANVDVNGTTSTADDLGTAVEISICLPDINRSGTVTVQDIFDYLTLYFSSDLDADYNNSFTVTVQDIFDFLAGYFTGCV